MEPQKTGQLIRRLRLEKRLTQQQLAQILHVSDKAISKWERGLGLPDVSLLADIAGFLRIDVETLLSGELDTHDKSGGNMKRTRFFFCPTCGNLVSATADAVISCCGKKLSALQPKKAEVSERLSVEPMDGEYFVSSAHPMTREHSISFVALLTGDSVLIRRLYPEWDLQIRLPVLPRARLLWFCTQHGLFEQQL